MYLSLPRAHSSTSPTGYSGLLYTLNISAYKGSRYRGVDIKGVEILATPLTDTKYIVPLPKLNIRVTLKCARASSFMLTRMK